VSRWVIAVFLHSRALAGHGPVLGPINSPSLMGPFSFFEEASAFGGTAKKLTPSPRTLLRGRTQGSKGRDILIHWAEELNCLALVGTFGL
jgi:hypothetical protein